MLNFAGFAQVTQTPQDSLALSEYYDMSLEQLDSIKATGVSSELEKLLNSLISVATQKSLSSRHTPSVVTLITEEEIKTSGARDLIDVLRLVPGFDFALDEQGRVGIGVRGNWATEGKVLLRIDGQEMNDIYTAKLYFGNHYPVDFIKRIEVIRGPGSAIYGGFAEYGVINIITKGANDLKGVSVGGVLGQMQRTYGQQNFEFYFGTRWKSKTFSISTFSGRGQRSDQNAYGFYPTQSLINQYGVGAYTSLAGNSQINPSFTNISFTYKNFSFRSISDFYEVTDVTSIDANGRRNTRYGTESNFSELSYKFKINNRLNILAKYNSIFQFPNTRDVSDSLYMVNFSNHINRNRLNLTANYDINHRVNVIGGVEGFIDYAKANTTGRFQVGDKDVSYKNIAAFGQSIFNLPWINITAGARYDRNSAFGHAFVPRLGLTRKFNRFHFKVLMSGGFRAPSIGNVYGSFNGTYNFNADSSNVTLNRGIKPERTTVFEVEGGYQFSSKVFLTMNIYDITIRQPIVYYFYQDDVIRQVFGEQAGVNVYQNFNRSGSRGLELDFRMKDTWGYLNFNYSFYTTAGKPRISAYAVSTFNRTPDMREEVNGNQLLAFANHKFNINWTYYIRKGFSANITATIYGPRYGYDILLTGSGKYDVDGQLIRTPVSGLVNTFFRRENLFTRGLNAGIGVYNLFNSHYAFLQPYFGLNAPLPGPSRELVIKLSYEVPFKSRKK